MVTFSDVLIDKIKGAASDTELENIIMEAVMLVKSKRLYNESTFIMNMIVSLNVIKTETTDPALQKNISVAIEQFREYRKQSQELLF